MYKYPILFFKGLIIGLGKIIPGISGSLIALNMGLYERGIYAISHFFKDIKNNFVFLSIVGSGIVISIIFGSRVISFFLTNNYYYTMTLFIGLIMGELPSLRKKTNIKNKKQCIYFILSFFFIIIISLFKNNNNYEFNSSIFNFIYIILIGFIDAATMIIPGISGTVIFMLIGCYEFFLSIFISLNSFNSILKNINIIFYFIVGLFLGMILITKLMNFFLEKKKEIGRAHV